MKNWNRQDLCDFIYDAHKTAFGTKGRHYDFDSMSMAELEREADRISEACDEVMAAEAAAEKKAIADFNKEVEYYKLLGAKTREDALRWMTQQDEFSHEQCVEHWVYNRGFLFTELGRTVVKELCNIVTFKEWECE